MFSAYVISHYQLGRTALGHSGHLRTSTQLNIGLLPAKKLIYKSYLSIALFQYVEII
jgi:hypothetical protein